MKVQLQAFLAAVLMVCLMAYIHIGLEIRFDINFNLTSTRPCGCNRCIVELNEDLWFTEHFNSSVPIMLNSRNYNLSNSTRTWWMRLQRHRSNKNYDVVKDTLFSLFPDKEYYNDSSHDRCRTCAVVGNSANLNSSMYGPLIDAHDFVLRMNQGPTKGFEHDVGTRTTHRAMYPVSAMDMDNSTHMVMLPFKVVDLQWLKSIFTTKHIKRTHIKVKSTIEANKDKVMIMNPAFMQYVHQQWLQGKGRCPSTGFFMLIFSLHICDQVNVFGFGADKKGRWLHYFDNRHRPGLNTGNHKGSFEHNILLDLHRKNKITMYKGW
ncbi:CMP-N-acetylneuraminate-beta-galactosamide-alpha-2,3-sialyltransferase 1-like [Trichomycterus rosablanca]|uniref:CMP-N-acetylneuraminate-beta-galactosamide- alpha-2,3-sialyltransferase 1-like n=1 Tax=Trichomycterus rosablanca TaxID=2290929 RepID=UPI002F35AB37